MVAKVQFIPGARLVFGEDLNNAFVNSIGNNPSVNAYVGGGTQSSQAPTLVYGQNNVTVSTASNTDAVNLPLAQVGYRVGLRNGTANTIDVFANPALNPVTNALDTTEATGSVAVVANTTAITVTTGVKAVWECFVAGIWSRVV
jgi:hypothetical protein